MMYISDKSGFLKEIKKIAGLLSILSMVCLSSVPVLADATGQMPGGVSLSIDGDGLRMTIGENWFHDSSGKTPYEKAEAETNYIPNTVVNIRTIPAENIEQISIDGKYIGIVLEPSDTGAFELDLVGVHNPDGVRTDASVQDGVLTLKAEADPRIGYINASEDRMINIVRLRVPIQAYSAIHVDGETAVIRMKDLGAPVSGTIDRGVLTVKDILIKSNCTLTTQNGNIMIQGDEISGSVNLQASNGSVGVKGKTVLGEVTLETANGSAHVTAQTLGKTNVVTKNGSVKVAAELLTKDVSVSSKNGSVFVNLYEEPENLTLAFSTASNGSRVLPDGWTDDKILGNGSPKLTMSCTNGAAELKFGREE